MAGCCWFVRLGSGSPFEEEGLGDGSPGEQSKTPWSLSPLLLLLLPLLFPSPVSMLQLSESESDWLEECAEEYGRVAINLFRASSGHGIPNSKQTISDQLNV